MLKITSSLFVFFLLISCTEKTQRDTDTLVHLGDSLSSSVGSALMKNLQTEITKDDLVGAAKFCSINAIELTSIQNSSGLSLSRTSLRVRNAENSPDAIDVAVLSRLGLQEAWNLPKHITMTEESGDHRYYKPIVIAETCLSCHGSEKEIPEEMKEFLGSNYPKDSAIGYKLGELRGAFKITVTDSLLKSL